MNSYELNDWVVVPREPTPEILNALRTGSRRDYPSDELCRVRWAAVIAAAPPVAAEPVAWMRPADDPFYDSAFRDHKTVAACTGNTWEGWIPLYTHLKAEPVNRRLLEALRKMIDLAEFWINREDRREYSDEKFKTWLALGHRSNAMREARAAIAAAEAQPALPTQEQVMQLADEYAQCVGTESAQKFEGHSDAARAALLAALDALPRE